VGQPAELRGGGWGGAGVLCEGGRAARHFSGGVTMGGKKIVKSAKVSVKRAEGCPNPRAHIDCCLLGTALSLPTGMRDANILGIDTDHY